MKLPGYILKRKLGQGGMAAVYLAEQESFGRDVALKVMMPQLAREPQFAERFMREARTVALLAHPNIVSVYDVGFYQTVHYIAMEYHTGGDLTQHMIPGINPGEALRIIRELADALAFAHERGIIHRDIKPDNILFRAHNNAAILTDFGIAKRRSEIDLTQAGSTVGTPKYMSPEQARGQILDGRSDLYSLGVILYEMLTGTLPFLADDPIALAIMHCQEPVPPLREPLTRYQPLLDRLLAKVPDERFNTGLELMEAIDALHQASRLAGSFGAQVSAPDRPVVAPERPAIAAPIAPAPAKPAAPLPRAGTGPAPKPYEPFYRMEETVSGGMLSKRYELSVAFSAEDYEEFKKRYQQFQDDLANWMDERGKKAVGLSLRIQVHPWIQGRVRDVVGRGRAENTPFGDMLHTGEVRLRIHDEEDEGEEVVLSEAGGKVPKPKDPTA